MFEAPVSVAESAQCVGSFSGTHVLAEMEGIDAALLDDETFLCTTLREALGRANATVCDVTSRQFQPQGVTVLALLSESHASLHTYPEIGSLFADVFTCGYQADPEQAMREIAEALGCQRIRLHTVKRGKDDLDGGRHRLDSGLGGAGSGNTDQYEKVGQQ